MIKIKVEIHASFEKVIEVDDLATIDEIDAMVDQLIDQNVQAKWSRQDE
ncbi:hypothetical protein ACS8E2_09640 [Psychrobacter glaciei]